MMPDPPPIRPAADLADTVLAVQQSRRLLIDTLKALSDFQDAITIDLIVPEAYAGPGRRAARIAGQTSAASRAVGLELAIWDRHRLPLASLDEPHTEIDAWVAGPAALLVAKAHKVHERLAQFATRPGRLRPKDSGDVGLLMMVTDPAEVAHVMATQSTQHPEIATVVADAARWLVEMYADPSSLLRQHAADSLSIRFDDAEVTEKMATWLETFTESLP